MINICFDNMNVNSVMNSSGIFTGSNVQLYWKTFLKNNFGFGNTIGIKNDSTGIINIVNDHDVIDGPMFLNKTCKSE
ncbi:hypothetical protein AMD01_10795 [Priestia koreensis]|uniref:Uncharacterized protein n=1 Tax=Priestia koreensis TaxID=284581 RepID=A0A0M0L5H7_9BACI|nr:hypothetical protein AMD01_10795 [Priestia koreensis]